MGYDRVGNRHSRSLTDANTALSSKVPTFTDRKYDRNDWVDDNGDATDANGNYDDNGNSLVVPSGDLTSGAIVPSLTSPASADSYDFENRLIQRYDGTTRVTIAYDGDGNRVRKTVVVGSTTTKTDYLVDDQNPTGYAQVLEEIETVNTGTPTLKRQYVYGHSLISENLIGSPTTIHYYGLDGHGNVRFLLNSSGQITDAYNYDAFGILLDQWPATGQTDNRYLYCGEQWDTDLGLYFLRPRYMNPKAGIFWTMDAFQGRQIDPLSLHKYLFCQANPINHVDPSGNDGELGELLLNISIRVGMYANYLVPVAVNTTIALGTLYIATSAVISVDDTYFGGNHTGSLYDLRDASGNLLIIAVFVTEGLQSVALTPPRPGAVPQPSKTIQVSKSQYPESAQHIEEAQAAGKPAILTVDRSTKVQNRAEALKNTPVMRGSDRDEYPPAVFREGGDGSSVRPIDPSDNRGSGAFIGIQLRDVPDGATVKIEVVE